MKHYSLLLLSICLLSLQAVSGQTSLKSRPFVLGLGGAYPLSPVVTVGGYHSNGWGGVLALHHTWAKAKNQPSDYSPGLRFYDDNLKDKVYWGSLRVSKLVTTDRKRLKFGWEAGPAWTQTITQTNFERMTSYALFSSNYSYTSIKKNASASPFEVKLNTAKTATLV